MRRLVLLTTNLARGGAEAQVAQLAIRMRQRAWEVSVVSLLPPAAWEEELAAADVPVFSLHMEPGKARPAGIVRLASILRRLRPQILHGHMFHGNLLGRVIRLICPVPAVISTIHSAAESSRRSTGTGRRDRLYRITDRLSDRTVCVCAAGAERHLAARAVSRGRLRVIPNGIDTGRFHPHAAERTRLRNEMCLGSKFAWLAAGRLMWKKDFPTMLQAMAGRPGEVLLVAGAGPLDAKLRSLAAELGGDVRFLGPREDVAGLMNACDGLLLSSVVEGLPLVLLEASASGLPAVATAVGGVGEAVLDERSGFLAPPGNPAAMSAAMSRLAGLTPEARGRMAGAAREHAQRFDWSVVAARWEREYMELLEAARIAGMEP